VDRVDLIPNGGCPVFVPWYGMMRPMILVPALVLALLVLVSPAPADAQIYRWVDEQGVPHYAQGIDSVPERYRATAAPIVIRNAPAPARAPAGTGHDGIVRPVTEV